MFNDSLPDGWGRLLFDRFARSQGVLPSDITPLDRLAHVGVHGMGALVYEPDNSTQETEKGIRLDMLAQQDGMNKVANEGWFGENSLRGR